MVRNLHQLTLFQQFCLTVLMLLFLSTVVGEQNYEDSQRRPSPQIKDAPSPKESIALTEQYLKVNTPPLITVHDLHKKRPKAMSGTAFTIDREGHWVTASHVVNGCQKISLIRNLESYKKGDVSRPWSYLAVVDDMVPSADLAVLKAVKHSKGQFALADDYAYDEVSHQRAFTTGFPSGNAGEAMLQFIGSRQAVMASQSRYGPRNVLQWLIIKKTDQTPYRLSGMSGGPVLDENGSVVGVLIGGHPRRARLISTNTKNLRKMLYKYNVSVDDQTSDNHIRLSRSTLGTLAQKLRDNFNVAFVLCENHP